MSSTNRSNAREEHRFDYYVTPINKIVEFLNEFNKHEDVLRKDIKILDSCAGGDEKHPMSYPEALKQIGVSPHNISTVDIREDSLANLKEDYLTLDCKNQFDVIFTNPPFDISRKIIDKALDDVKDGGYVIMLLRLNYLGGDLRKDLWAKHMPSYIFVHSKRISFTDDGKTDSIEYAHYVWKKGKYPKFSKLMVI